MHIPVITYGMKTVTLTDDRGVQGRGQNIKTRTRLTDAIGEHPNRTTSEKWTNGVKINKEKDEKPAKR